jgi:LysR family transcriptional regulator, glycine cleavage system transcriptional activator
MSPMFRNLPGLAGMPAFEAAARHASFTKAAVELGVTPAAVSHQMRAIEDQLGVRLFRRVGRSVRLTPAGEILEAAAREALDGLTRAVVRVRGADGPETLKVTTAPSFGAKWLVPRLDRFLRAHPGCDVRIDASQRMVDFVREDQDIAIRFGKGDYPGLRVERLFEETTFPVSSPKLIAGRHPLRHPSDLRHHALIHVEWQAQGETWPNWRMWLDAAGVSDIDPTRGIHFSQTTLAIQAAIDGQGVVLGDSTLVTDDLACGRLVRPFDLSLKGPAQFAYYLVSPRAATEKPLVAAFRAWALAEAQAMTEANAR